MSPPGRRKRVLVVDDSVVLRKLIGDIVGSAPDLEVAALASNGQLALARLPLALPDVVLLDVEMPELDGIATLRAIRKLRPELPVVMCSALTQRGAATTLEALALGANDYVCKPSSSDGPGGREAFADQVLAKLRTLAHPAAAIPTAPRTPAFVPPATTPASARPSLPLDVVAIGVSTGGPNALARVLPALPRELRVPVVIVQHMPPVFTKLLADRLNRVASITVSEAEDGMPLVAGQALVAPGGRHLSVERRGDRMVAALGDGPPENSCRPAVDVLLRSVAEAYGDASLAVILTGMGQDGLRGCERVRARGGAVLAQDQASSVVWGMPGFVTQAGLADEVLPLDRMAEAIVRRTNVNRRVAAAPAVSRKELA